MNLTRSVSWFILQFDPIRVLFSVGRKRAVMHQCEPAVICPWKCSFSPIVCLGRSLLLLQADSSQWCREVSGEESEFLGLVKKLPSQ